MKICFINHSYSQPVWDGIATYTHSLSLGLSLYGHTVYIITQQNDRLSFKAFKSKDIRLIFIKPLLGGSFNQNGITGQLGTIVYHLQVLFKLIKLDKTCNFDVIEAPETAGEGFLPSIFFQNKLVTRLHTPSLLSWLLDGVEINFGRQILAKMEKYQINRSRWVSAPSLAVIEKVEELFGIKKKIEIYQNPLIDFSNHKLRTIKEKNYILFIGKIQINKGFDVFVEAFKNVKKNFPDLSAIIIGDIDKTYDGEKFQKIKKQFPNLGIKCLMGVKNDLVLSYLKNAKMVVMPSFWENSSYALIEALMMGKMTIVTSGGGFKEIIQDGENGFLVRPQSPSSLSKKMISILKLSSNRQKTVEEAARKTSKLFLPEKIIPKIIKFYQHEKN